MASTHPSTQPTTPASTRRTPSAYGRLALTTIALGILGVLGLGQLSPAVPAAPAAPAAQSTLAPAVVTRKYEKAISLTAATGFTVRTARVPAGTYLINYNAIVYGASGAVGWCWAKTTNPARFAAATSTTSNSGGFFGLNGSGLVTLRDAQRISVKCGFDASADLDTNLKAPFQITLTRIDSVTRGTATLARAMGD